MKKKFTFLFLFAISISIFSQTTEEKSEKIATFCKVWGFLKYYHPTVSNGKLDWDKEFRTRINIVKLLNSKQEISDYYSSWIKDLGSIPFCQGCIDKIPDSLKINLNLDWISDTTSFTENLVNQLLYIQRNRNQGHNYYVQQMKYTGNTIYKNEKTYNDSIFPSIEMRLLGLSRYWNIINYFYPYKYLTDQNWNDVLIEMIPKFNSSRDTISYHLAMLELTTKINDSHAVFKTEYTEQYFGEKWVPFIFRIIDNKAIVTDFYSDSLCRLNDIRVGDIFLEVNDISIEKIIKEKSKYIRASNESAKLNTLFNAVFGGSTDSVKVKFERNENISQKFINRYYFQKFNYKWTYGNKNDVYKVLNGNIGYVNIGILYPKRINAMMYNLKDTRAIIFDCRNYPNQTADKLSDYLLKDKLPFAKWMSPDLNYPGTFKFSKLFSCGKKNKDYYKGKVVLLINEESQSQAETLIMKLQKAPDVICIGSNTAGANGNISSITFPGNYKTWMSGIGAFFPDGSTTQRTGIKPDIEIKPTIEGIKKGVDELLIKAIEVINKK